MNFSERLYQPYSLIAVYPIFVVTDKFMHSLITLGVQVSVEIFYQHDNSKPMQHEFLFAYRITLENQNPFSVQLLRRQWYIFDSNGDYRQVEGEGVVGLQPVIKPGQTFQYVSGCNLKSEMGKMWGHYTMVDLSSNKSFNVKIPEFQMIAPMKLS